MSMNDSRNILNLKENRIYSNRNYAATHLKSSHLASTPFRNSPANNTPTNKKSYSPRFNTKSENDCRSPNLSAIQKIYSQENNGYSKLVTEKELIQSRLHTIRAQNKQFIERENFLKNEIKKINQKSAYTMQALEQRKEMLLKEKDDLLNAYQFLPPVEFLRTQLSVLDFLLSRKKNENQTNQKAEINEEIMRKLGIIQRSNEDISVVPERLAYLVNRLETFKQAYKEMTPKSRKSLGSVGTINNESLFDPTAKERKELMRKIKLLKVSMKASFRHTEFQCESLRSDVHRLEAECEMIQTIQASIPRMGLRKTKSFSTGINKLSLSHIPINETKSDDCDISFDEDSDFIDLQNSETVQSSMPIIPLSNRTRARSSNLKQSGNKNQIPHNCSNVESEKSDPKISDENANETIAISPLSNLNIFDQDVQRILKGSGGDLDLLHYNGNNEYEYNGFRFMVIKQETKLYAVSENETIILPIFLSNIVYL